MQLDTHFTLPGCCQERQQIFISIVNYLGFSQVASAVSCITANKGVSTMLQAIRPYFTSGVVLVGASVLVIAPISVPPPELATPSISISTAEVLPASLVSDLLTAFNTVSVAGGDSAQILRIRSVCFPGGLPPR